ncbi:inositol polyphosphate 5-phosphatase OCRL-like isoform X1 [Haliotis rufescens]|uniref:inositol polyphosphate 5-phosphatase OCRL-like isoform X1 n=2 Tax=Haliotis rufescens TaxID=6454 RepID=UPI00201F3376|nr:inositol polyphosphate 5-phosphatase OCRL-like isoform X1 [Haliotis rufescens]
MDSIERNSTELVPRKKEPGATTLCVTRRMDVAGEDGEEAIQRDQLRFFRVFCGTWNVNEQSPMESLGTWLEKDDEPPDIYAIGFQELDMSIDAMLSTDSKKEAEWEDAVKTYLHPKAKYIKVKSCRLMGILLLVYIQEQHIPTDVDAEQVATGIMGFMGNKGGVGIRMTICNTSICFINSHLTAREEEIERRNQDYRDISSKMTFKQFSPPMTPDDHDLIFWFGDLNFRIDDMPANELKNNIDNNQYTRLLSHDQLCKLLGKSDVFAGYTEGVINFRPTYRYDSGTDNWDTSEKRRPPAWCDRVLWKGSGIRQLRYNSHPELKISDHKPVSALFDAGIRVGGDKSHRTLTKDAMGVLDRIEEEYTPQVKLNTTEFYFENVRFIEPQQKELAITNTGRVPVEYKFINELDGVKFCIPWLKVSPRKHTVMPGDSSDVCLEVFIDKEIVRDLNFRVSLDDILVLRLNSGRDIFIPIHGTYVPSSFGTSIETLVYVHGPIRDVTVEELIQVGGAEFLSSTDPYNSRKYICPKEIFRLVNHLYKYGGKKESMFLKRGHPSEIKQIRDALDTGSPEYLPGSVHSVAEALLLFLESLPEPVIPSAFYHSCLQCSTDFQRCKKVLQLIPDSHRNVFKYLCAFLRERLKFADQNNLDVKILASLFGNVFLRAPPSSSKDDRQSTTRHSKSRARAEDSKKTAFVFHFLTNEYDE